MAITDTDLARLRRCVELARDALRAGDEPFGSLLRRCRRRSPLRRPQSRERRRRPPPVAILPITTVAPGVITDGPADSLAEAMKSLYAERFRRG